MKRLIVVLLAMLFLAPTFAMAQNSINSGNASGPANNNVQNSAAGGSVTGPSNSVSGSGLQIGVNQQGQSNAVGQGGQGGNAGVTNFNSIYNQPNQSQSINNSGNSRNTNRNTNQNDNTNVNRNSNRQGQGQGQLQGQRQGQIGSVSTDVSVSGDEFPRQAPPASAPNLVAAPETCMGSSAVGVSSPFGGVSVGTTYKSNDCELRMFARSLMSLGQPEAALALLAQNEKVAVALRAVGHKAAWLQQEKDLSVVVVSPASTSLTTTSALSAPPSRDSAKVACKTGEAKIRAGNGEYFCR